ncbi:MAG TPA: YncE family protein [Candidatus Angelobacter sp.]|nr:YncE family protein [Candidatus Angelobacter sp.]
MFLWHTIGLSLLISTLMAAGSQQLPAQKPTQDYLVFVVCESADTLALLRFGPGGLYVEKQTKVGMLSITDINGPHGIAVSPDKKYVYIAIAHGRPFGSAWKFDAATLAPLQFTNLGLFPATSDISKDGSFLFVANANFHGDMKPSSVSAIATDEMIEVKRIPTCTMPHGSRLNPQGTKHYSACMMDDLLVEIDTASFSVSRHFILSRGKEKGLAGAPASGLSGPHRTESSHSETSHRELACTPTWAQPSNDGSLVYVACNQTSDIVVVDVQSWKMVRRFPAGPGVYNLAVTKNGRVIATNKRGQSVSIFDSLTGKELARIPTRRKVVHGVVVTPDDRYAFISAEGIGSEPGTVEVIDLETLKTVATADVGEQAAGIDVWKIESSKPPENAVGTKLRIERK